MAEVQWHRETTEAIKDTVSRGDGIGPNTAELEIYINNQTRKYHAPDMTAVIIVGNKTWAKVCSPNARYELLQAFGLHAQGFGWAQLNKTPKRQTRSYTAEAP